ncbi:MAG: response regulator transcription factor [Bacteroidales bacterium]|nr:response regulator transcription factor [Bacteroidales bacterium]
MIKIAIVDDRDHVRETLESRLQYTDEIKVIHTSSNGQEFLTYMKSIQPFCQPDVVIMDIEMPVLNGIETVATASVLYPDVKYIMLTVFDSDDAIFNAIKAGAHGYLLKDEDTDTIIEHIKLVSDGKGAVMSPAIARKALDLLLAKGGKSRSSEGTIKSETSLTEREIAVLECLVNGLDHKSISQKLDISPATVRTHLANIYKKLHVSSKTQAVGLALKRKWF